jgi:hypothetical protein
MFSPRDCSLKKREQRREVPLGGRFVIGGLRWS